MRKVTDPNLLKALEDQQQPTAKKVVDPELLAQLESDDSGVSGQQDSSSFMDAAKKGIQEAALTALVAKNRLQHNIGFGLGDEATAVAQGVGSFLTGNGYKQGFEKERAYQKAVTGALEQLAPSRMEAYDVGASVLNPFPMGKATKLGGKIVQGMAAGGATGGATGFGKAEGDIEERLPSALKGAEIGAGVGAALPVVGAGVKAGWEIGKAGAEGLKRMSNALMFGTDAAEKAASKFAKQGELLTKATGIDLTAGQQTGSRAILRTEDLLRSQAATSDRMFEDNMKKVGKVKAYFDKVANNIEGRSRDIAQVGTDIKKAFDETSDNIFALRAKQAKGDFNLVHQASGGKPIFEANNFFATLDDLINIGNQPGALPTEKSAAAIARGLKKDFTPTIKTVEGNQYTGAQKVLEEQVRQPLTALQFQKQLQRFGKYSKGNLTISEQLDKASSSAFAKRLFGALQKDLEEVATSGTGDNSPAAGALQVARENYRILSESLRELDDTALSKVVGSESANQPEKIFNSIMRFEPSGMKQAFDILSKAKPELVPEIQKAAVQKAISEAFLEPGVKVAKTSVKNRFDPQKLLSNLPSDQELKIIFGGSAKGMAIKKQLIRGVRATERLLQTGNVGASPTQPLTEMNVIMRMVARADLPGLAGKLISMGRTKELADIVLDPKKLKTLETISGGNAKAIAKNVSEQSLAGLVNALKAAATDTPAGSQVRKDLSGVLQRAVSPNPDNE